MTSPLPLLDECPVAVKPLEWSGDFAHTAFGLFYFINNHTSVPGWVVLEKHDGSATMSSGWGTLDEAKAAAQADYEQRIRSALVPVAAPVAAGSDEVPGLRDRLPLLAKWLSQRSYFNEAKDIYGVLHFLKTAEARAEASESRCAALMAALKPFADAVYNDNGDVTISGVNTRDYLRARAAYRSALEAQERTA